MAYKRKDSYYQRAKEEGYRSRAAYKLLELDRRHGLLRPGQRVIDLGCAPGGWLQVAAQRVGKRGRVVGIDRLEVPDLGRPNILVLRGDITAADTPARLTEALGGPADLVLSDMAPDTSGVAFADHSRSVELVRLAAETAVRMLREGGAFCAKIFDGPELDDLVRELKPHFGKIRRIRPDATRKGSRELYLLCAPRRAPARTDADTPAGAEA